MSLPVASAQTRAVAGPCAAPDEVDTLAADQLAKDYKVSSDEALARMQRQRYYVNVNEDFQSMQGDSWAGSYIDQSHGGALVLLSTDSRTDLTGLPMVSCTAGMIHRQVVAHSFKELTDDAGVVSEALRGNGATFARPYVDVDTNSLVVPVPGDAPTVRQMTNVAGALSSASVIPPTSAQLKANTDLVTGVLASRGYPAHVQVLVEHGGPAGCYDDVQACDAPMRGGLLSYATNAVDPGSEICTLGFSTLDLDTLRFQVLSAGHCSSRSPNRNAGTVFWQTRMYYDNLLHTVGHATEANYMWTSTVDASAIDLDNQSGWSPAGEVLVQANSGPHPTTLNQRYPIHSVGSASSLGKYAYLCSTGMVSRTRCGQLMAWGVQGSAYTGNLAATTVPVCEGDSGGPYYVSNVGYGIAQSMHLDADQNYVKLDYGDIWHWVYDCTTGSYYQGLAGAAAAFHLQVLLE